MKNLIYLFLISIIFACIEKGTNQKEKKSTESVLKHVETKSMNIKDFDAALIDPCDTFSVEVEGIYPELDTLPLAHLDTAFLDNDLKKRGFKTITGGWGNFEEGPRILAIVMSDGKCNCSVYKKYIAMYSIGEDGEIRDFYRVVERMVCNARNNGVE